MRSLLRKLAKLLRLVALAALVGSIIRAALGKKRPEVTGEASWPPLADDKSTHATQTSAPTKKPATTRTQAMVAEAVTAETPSGDDGSSDRSSRSDPAAAPSTSEPAPAARSAAEPTTAEPSADRSTAERSHQSWVEPVGDGACPASHPIKGNAQSMIFHVPGGRSYDRTKAERCYASAEAAEADGFRKAKR